MKKKLSLATLLVAAAALTAVFGMHAFAGSGKTHLKADMLTGYQESTPAAVSSPATGTFEATIDDESQTIEFTLTYSGLSAPITVSHIHLGDRAQNGGVSAFICGGGAQPNCPTNSTAATITGTITAANVTGPAGQGIAPGEWQELVDAMRAGATYINVHDGTFPAGEIRGQINDDNQRQP
jgi:CHRD domain